MRYICFCISIIITFFIPTSSYSQTQSGEYITLQECIDLGLENNPSIKIIENREQIAQNNHSYQPFMPSLGTTARLNNSNTDSKRRDASRIASDGSEIPATEVEFHDIKSSEISAGINFSWRIFDGLGMFANYKKSGILLSVSEIQTRRTVENLILNISNSYFRILVQQHRVEAAAKTLVLSRERYRIIDEKVNIGSASGLERHQARLDFNADSSNIVRQKENLQNLYIQLNTLMNIDFSKTNYIADTILLGMPLVLSDLELETSNNNTYLLASQLGIEQTFADLRIARAARFPTLNFTTGYSYRKNEAPSSSTTFSQSQGFNYGFDLGFNIFNGFQVNRNIQNTKLELENRKLSYEETELQIMSDLHTLYNTYINNLMMVDFESQTVEVSLVNLDLALERYDLGALSGLDFREFQLSYLNSVDRLLTAMYQAKANELSLLVLSGRMEEFVQRIQN